MAHFHETIHCNRIKQFHNHIKRKIVVDSIPLPVRYGHSVEPTPFSRVKDLAFVDGKEGDLWGRTWESAWFEVNGDIPEAWDGAYVVLQAELGGEILVCDSDGNPLVGLTNGSVFDFSFGKPFYHMLPKAKAGEKVHLWLEAAANGLFGVHKIDPEFNKNPDQFHGHYEGRVQALRLVRFDYALWQLHLDVEMLFELAQSMDKESARRAAIIRGLSRAVSAYETDGPEACKEALNPLMEMTSDPAAMDLYAVGHAHIDTGWMWPVRETIRKCARTFSSQLHLISRYPDYVFGASQAQHYQMVKDHYPRLYARIKDAVKKGAWELQGAMWVEADCNVPSGESLIRQVLHGKNFFMDEFGVEIKNLWLPDVFGYSANLPQILRRAGIDYFLTQKLSWSKYNKFPHKTFVWEGIDGSQVLAHFPPEDTYNAGVRPEELRKVEANNPERGIVTQGLSLFGVGNGGGGPKEEHVERALRAYDLNGLPRYKMSHAQPVLEELGKLKDELSVWVGELYLEVHRGTLTTQAKTKLLMRRGEEALRATEMLCAAAGLETYPAEILDRLWKTLLINQFHDILPGSSINMVYEQTERELAEIIDTCDGLMATAAERLFKPADDKLILFNPSSTPFSDTVELPDDWTGAAADTALLTQAGEDGCVAAVNVPPCSFVELSRTSAAPAAVTVTPANEGAVLENDRVSYAFDASLRLVSAYDKETGRELFNEDTAGNVLSLYEDRPHSWDAWDVDEYYEETLLEQAVVQSITLTQGPIRQELSAHMTIGNSTLIQIVSLRQDSKRLDFETEVDWQERHKMLRVAFETNIRAESATAEVQYGHIRRTNNRNTYWDHACFEAVAHRWIDVSEPDYGVSLLNDCKYGHKALGGTLDVNLLRAPTMPDPVADIGQHSFTYSFFPHASGLDGAGVQAEAAMLNQGLTCLEGVELAGQRMPVSLDGEGVELAVLKKAEKEDCLVARVVETRGRHTTAVITAPPAATIVPTNLMEWTEDADAAATGRLEISLSPFEIATFKIKI
ncbi:MAG: glycoside hydrolase family 38 C-terminal domain-containing protein [Lentisphaeria bacterium]|nr:glycoside hydrolase family 38 C-terminal domain-containing protein [Lentisphaeria bacterium]